MRAHAHTHTHTHTQTHTHIHTHKKKKNKGKKLKINKPTVVEITALPLTDELNKNDTNSLCSLL